MRNPLLPATLALALGAANASAQSSPTSPERAPAPPPGSPPPPETAVTDEIPPPPADRRTRARELYTEAITDYTSGNLGLALEKLDQAFVEHDAPTILLARAMTLDKLGRADDAKTAYVTYLRRRPDDPEAGRIRARIDELSGPPPAAPLGALGPAATDDGLGPAPSTVVADAAPQPPPAPSRVNEPRTRDGALFLRVAADAAHLAASRAVDEGSGPIPVSGTTALYGVSGSLGYMPTAGFALAIGAGVGSHSLELQDEGGAEEYSRDESGPALFARAEIHGFPSPRGPLHLMGSAGVGAFGREEMDGFLGPVVGGGIGAAFFVSDQSSIDLLARVEVMTGGERPDTSATILGISVGWLNQ